MKIARKSPDFSPGWLTNDVKQKLNVIFLGFTGFSFSNIILNDFHRIEPCAIIFPVIVARNTMFINVSVTQLIIEGIIALIIAGAMFFI